MCEVSVINIILSQIITFDEHASFIEELKWNFLQIRGKGDGIWFVAALFMTFIPFYFFVDRYEKSEKQRNERIIFIIVALLLSIISNVYEAFMDPTLLPWGTVALPWHLEYVFQAMFYMTIGYLFKGEFERMYDKTANAFSTVVVFFVYIVFRYIPYIMAFEIENFIPKMLYTYLCAFLGIFVLIFVSKRIVPNRYLLYIGQNTLICFAFHGKIYTVLQTILKSILGVLYGEILGNMYASSVFAIVLTIVLSFILIIPIYVINRWLPFLLGRGYRTRVKELVRAQ
ncbi:hypothetical protein SAMN04487928_15510 [Butyrivibrio proteoclasticus]|uniref:Acyltransferase 3 domain-containing protein n=1 Tax=Butyrivibrio proteoclasticus TaxID=43305 RepID=A0A1I5YS63_9FIRM|nr:acyltransferase family protein [Butyrivibrio proteoclasticus]SFQ47049.1 hypothetical protein SAMN04487928_15510 [Butyrivibrio proteoclasticus]